jgi:hypothetical protein
LPPQVERFRHATNLPDECNWETIFARLVSDPTSRLPGEAEPPTEEASSEGAEVVESPPSA